MDCPIVRHVNYFKCDGPLDWANQVLAEEDRAWGVWARELQNQYVKPKHNDPVDFGIDEKKQIKMRLVYLRRERRLLITELTDLNARYAIMFEKKGSWLYRDRIIIYKNKLYKINQGISFNKRRLEDLKNPNAIKPESYDVEYIRSIPIDSFVEVNRMGFFMIREERTPSCKWYREDNTWVDFGGDNRKHDVIDLIMITRGVSFIEACRYLSGC